MDEPPHIREDTPDAAEPGLIWIWGLIGFCVLIEVVLSAGDAGLIGPARLRQTAYDWGGFWPGLLFGAPGNFPGQSWAMFLTYGFLHGGPVHLAVNMATLWSLGRAVIDRVGAAGFGLLYGMSLLGGAAGYGVLVRSGWQIPMVGASGALFGLAGGLLAWDYVDRYSLRERRWPVARMVGLLVAMNVAMWWGLGGQLAWQTHLGGFLTGWLGALLIDPRSHAGDPEPPPEPPPDRPPP
jgi:rhomboid protease GluP